MKALNKTAARADASTVLLDRHVAAFAASRSSAVEAVLLRVVPEDSPADKRVVALAFFSDLQSRFNCGPLKGFAKAFAKQLGPLADALRSRTRRKQIKDHIAAAKADGDLAALLVGVHAVTKNESDEKNFRRFVAHYAALQSEIDDLKVDDSYAVRLGNEIGGRAAVAPTCVLLVLSVALSVFGIGV
jgi:hypothetical protein